MALLRILQYPDPRLHRVAEPVCDVNDEVRALIADMAQTMYAAPGVGLAATQVDVHKRIVIVDTSDTRDELLALINPVIVERSGTADYEEGCLSVPGIFDTVTRSERIIVHALDRHGKRFETAAEGMRAVCIQHEMDHLEGRVFVEYLSRLKQQRILARLKKQQRRVM